MTDSNTTCRCPTEEILQSLKRTDTVLISLHVILILLILVGIVYKIGDCVLKRKWRARESSSSYRRFRHPSASPHVHRTPLGTPSVVLQNIPSTTQATGHPLAPPGGSNSVDPNARSRATLLDPSYMTFSDLVTPRGQQNQPRPSPGGAKNKKIPPPRPPAINNNNNQACEYGYENVVLVAPEEIEVDEEDVGQATGSDSIINSGASGAEVSANIEAAHSQGYSQANADGSQESTNPDAAQSLGASGSSQSSLRLRRIQMNGSDYTLVSRSTDNLHNFKVQPSEESEDDDQFLVNHSDVVQNATDLEGSLESSAKQQGCKIKMPEGAMSADKSQNDQRNVNNNNTNYDKAAVDAVFAYQMHQSTSSGATSENDITQFRKSDRNKERRRTLYEQVEWWEPNHETEM